MIPDILDLPNNSTPMKHLVFKYKYLVFKEYAACCITPMTSQLQRYESSVYRVELKVEVVCEEVTRCGLEWNTALQLHFILRDIVRSLKKGYCGPVPSLSPSIAKQYKFVVNIIDSNSQNPKTVQL